MATLNHSPAVPTLPGAGSQPLAALWGGEATVCPSGTPTFSSPSRVREPRREASLSDDGGPEWPLEGQETRGDGAPQPCSLGGRQHPFTQAAGGETEVQSAAADRLSGPTLGPQPLLHWVPDVPRTASISQGVLGDCRVLGPPHSFQSGVRPGPSPSDADTAGHCSALG